MKKLIILFAGFGLILLAGCWESISAKDKDSVLPGYIQPIDSSMVSTLQERAEKNFAYVKADPADPGKVAGEMMAGGLGAIMGGVVFGKVGFGLASDGGGGGFGCCDVGGLIGGLVGYLVGSNMGSATGVCLVGNTGGEKGSFWAGFGGSLLGTLVGGICAAALARDLDDDSGTAPLFVLTAAQAGGATLGFNATRKKKVEVPSGAMLNLKDDKLTLALPEVNAYPDSFGSANLRIDIFQANF